jgi:hypothetical protein
VSSPRELVGRIVRGSVVVWGDGVPHLHVHLLPRFPAPTRVLGDPRESVAAGPAR